MTEDEEGLFEALESREVLALGWVHTHPTQTCFMSSVDLHTHCSYQLMLPEAVAVVLAPRSNPSRGVFRLTDPMGLNLIANCELGLGFHPHPDLPNGMDIYRAADSAVGGHVSLMDGGDNLTIVDLR
ncbi:hypothetical protein HDU96_002918 [Phlyctochytrium bullatum]|nr:hypothetical protein HDU96_002918 [Phlyctochytrium bullatum]